MQKKLVKLLLTKKIAKKYNHAKPFRHIFEISILVHFFSSILKALCKSQLIIALRIMRKHNKWEYAYKIRVKPQMLERRDISDGFEFYNFKVLISFMFVILLVPTLYFQYVPIQHLNFKIHILLLNYVNLCRFRI